MWTSVVLALFLGAAQGYKDDSYYMTGSGNPNVNEKMYWKDAENVLQDLSKFKSLYVEFSHCSWTWNQMEDADNDVEENDYWYMGKIPPMGANVAYSLYGTLKGETFKGCNKNSFINSFYTNAGFQDFAKAMYYAGQTKFSSAYASDDDSSGALTADCMGGYGVGCDYTNGFAVHTYSTDVCDPAYVNGVSDDLYDLNQAMNNVECVQIYHASSSSSSSSSYYSSSSSSGTALDLLESSSACFYQNYMSPDGDCPDPYGKISYYQENFAKGIKESKKAQPYAIYNARLEKGKNMAIWGGLLLGLAGLVFFMEAYVSNKYSKKRGLASGGGDGFVDGLMKMFPGHLVEMTETCGNDESGGEPVLLASQGSQERRAVDVQVTMSDVTDAAASMEGSNMGSTTAPAPTYDAPSGPFSTYQSMPTDPFSAPGSVPVDPFSTHSAILADPVLTRASTSTSDSANLLNFLPTPPSNEVDEVLASRSMEAPEAEGMDLASTEGVVAVPSDEMDTMVASRGSTDNSDLDAVVASRESLEDASTQDNMMEDDYVVLPDSSVASATVDTGAAVESPTVNTDAGLAWTGSTDAPEDEAVALETTSNEAARAEGVVEEESVAEEEGDYAELPDNTVAASTDSTDAAFDAATINTDAAFDAPTVNTDAPTVNTDAALATTASTDAPADEDDVEPEVASTDAPEDEDTDHAVEAEVASTEAAAEEDTEDAVETEVASTDAAAEEDTEDAVEAEVTWTDTTAEEDAEDDEAEVASTDVPADEDAEDAKEPESTPTEEPEVQGDGDPTLPDSLTVNRDAALVSTGSTDGPETEAFVEPEPASSMDESGAEEVVEPESASTQDTPVVESPDVNATAPADDLDSLRAVLDGTQEVEADDATDPIELYRSR